MNLSKLFPTGLKRRSPFKSRSLQKIILFCLLAALGLGTGIGLPHLSRGIAMATPPTLAQASPLPDDLMREAEGYYANGQYAQAKTAWLAVINVLETEGESPLQLARALSNLSLTHQQLGEWQRARDRIDQSLKILGIPPGAEVLQPTSQEVQYLRVLAQTADIRGQLNYLTGQTEKALTTWQQTQRIYQNIRHLRGELGSLLNQAQAYQALGQYLRARTNLAQVETALPENDTALRLTLLQSLAQTERLLGNLAAAIERLEAAEALSRNSAPALGAALALNKANTYRAMALRRRDLGKPAEEAVGQALEAYAIATNQASLMAQPGAKLTQLQGALGQLKLQTTFPEQVTGTNLAATIAASKRRIDDLLQDPTLPLGRPALFAQIGFAESLLDLAAVEAEPDATYGKVTELLGDAAYQAQQVGDFRAAAYARGLLGQAYALAQQPTAAQDLTQQAIFLSTEAHAPDMRYRWHRQLGELLEQQDQPESALNAYRAATEDLRKVRNDLLTVDSEVQFSFRDNVEPVYREFIELLIKTADDQTESGQARITEALKSFDELQLAEISNFLGCSSTREIKLELVDDPKAAVVYAITLSDRIAVILDLPGKDGTKNRRRQLLSREILRQRTPDNKPAVDLVEKLQTFQAALEDYFREREAQQLSKELYGWFFQPIEARLAEEDGLDTLVFVLDGDLRNISLAALQDEQGQYLIEKYSLALTPGIDLFEPKPLPSQPNILLGGIQEGQKNLEGFKIPPIPRLETELLQVQNFAREYESLTGKDFTSGNIRRALSQANYSIVHFKAHGKFSSDPQETFIAAFDELIRGRELGNLIQAGNIGEEQLIDLLTLSACETARGDNRAVLGITGVAVRAGARSVVSSLWKANNRKTIQVMSRFYETLFGPNTNGATRAEALRIAQLELKNEGARLRDWAPYVLVGNWR